LIAYFDVTSLTRKQRGDLMLEIAVQADSNERHHHVPPPTFQLRTTSDDGGIYHSTTTEDI